MLAISEESSRGFPCVIGMHTLFEEFSHPSNGRGHLVSHVFDPSCPMVSLYLILLGRCVYVRRGVK